MSDGRLERMTMSPRSGNETFLVDGQPAAFALLDFWRWSSSDLVSNALRGVLAEFIVAKALAISTDCVRTEWDMCDLKSPSGLLIEVKSAAYLQSWAQAAPSRISFVVTPRRAWDADTNTMAEAPRRHADVYVFALLAHQDKGTVNPLDLSQWQFWALHRSVLDGRTRSQHSITLPTLSTLAGPPVSFSSLAVAVERATERGRTPGE